MIIHEAELIVIVLLALSPLCLPSAAMRSRLFTIIIAAFVAIGFLTSPTATLLAPIFGVYQNLSVLPTGPLDKHLGVFLPASLKTTAWAIHGFSAVVFAQCMHYLAVIYVMPRLLQKFMPNSEIKPFLPWPDTRFFWAIVLGFTGTLITCYTFDFAWARSIYGIAAAVHAYVEIPLLLLAFAFIRKNEGLDFQSLLTPHSLSTK